jgi:hypothetical protein
MFSDSPNFAAGGANAMSERCLLDQELIQKLLNGIPGAKRAADGVILTGSDGTTQFHVTGVTDMKLLKEFAPEEYAFTRFCAHSEVRRLRSLRTPHDFLLRLRANAIADSPRAQRVFSSRRRAYESSGREWSLTHYYHSMDRHQKNYMNLLDRQNYKALKSVPAGLALVDEANAVCLRSFVGDVVVVSESLEHFYYFMTLGFLGNTMGLELIDRLDALLIAMRIMNGAEALDFDLDPRGALPREVERETRAIVDAQMRFTFGHEYAHYLRKHLPSPYEIRVAPNALQSQHDVLLYEHALEYEADLYAVKHVARNREEQKAVAQGGLSALLYLSFLDDFARKFGTRRMSVSTTHPNPRMRMERLRASLGSVVTTTDEEFENWFEVSEQMQEFLTKYMSHARPDVLTFYGSIYLKSFVGKLKRDRLDF